MSGNGRGWVGKPNQATLEKRPGPVGNPTGPVRSLRRGLVGTRKGCPKRSPKSRPDGPPSGAHLGTRFGLHFEPHFGSRNGPETEPKNGVRRTLVGAPDGGTSGGPGGALWQLQVTCNCREIACSCMYLLGWWVNDDRAVDEKIRQLELANLFSPVPTARRYPRGIP
jgi:hypothetical protein